MNWHGSWSDRYFHFISFIVECYIHSTTLRLTPRCCRVYPHSVFIFSTVVYLHYSPLKFLFSSPFFPTYIVLCTKNTPTFFKIILFVQLNIFLYTTSSLISNRCLHDISFLQLLVCGQSNKICLLSSTPKNKGHVSFTIPFLLPLNFQIPSLRQAVPLLSFLLQHAT
jgi:hypothetical protein